MIEHPEQPRPNTGPNHLDDDQTPVTVAKAAQLLGLSAEAVRSRVQRGTLGSKKVDGTVYVLLDTDQASLSDTQTDEEGRLSRHLSGDQTEFIASLQAQVDWLRREVERKDTLLMTLMQRVPELEAPEKPSKDSQTAPGSSDKGQAPREQQEPSQGRSWWSRFFFGP